jgi:PAS domain S-box-containing protein
MLETMRGRGVARVAFGSWSALAGVAQSLVVRYAPAVACVAAALGLSQLLWRAVDPTAVFLAAVAVATWSGGWRAGLLAAGLAAITVDYFFVPPLHSFVVTAADLPRLGVFVACALAVNWAGDARRVAVERALRESERQLRALFDEAPVGIALVNATGHAFKTNRKLQDLFGYNEEEFRSFSFTKVTHPPDVESDWNLFSELVRGKRDSYQLEKQCRTKDGRLVWGNLTVSLVRDDRGQPMFGIAVVEDVTDRKCVESELRRSEAFLAEGQRQSHTGSWRWNLPSNKAFFSQEALRIVGLDPEQPEPRLATVIQRIHPADMPSAERTLESATRHRQDYDLDLRVVLPDESIRYVRIVGRPMVNLLGEREYIGVLMDMSARPRVDDAP